VSVATHERYVPAAGYRLLTRLYDPVVALTMRERHYRSLLAQRLKAALPDGGTAVDVGCGTGTFAIEIATARPDATVIGVDRDHEVLTIARTKRLADRVDWRAGLAGELPLENGSADAASMSLLLHHLQPSAKDLALADVRRVLRPGGTLHVADWGRPEDPVMRAAFGVLQAIDGFSNTRDHAAGRLPALIAGAGFEGVTTYARLRTVWGSLELIAAQCA
jgi:ubiquinone/menaquinone biosynthesis C-methylase UbiE